MLRVFVIFAALTATACLPTDYRPPASQSYQLGEVLLREDFESRDAWQNYEHPAGRLEVRDGTYHIWSDGSIVWGLNRLQHSDVLIEVDARDHSQHRNNGYGVMCRARRSNNGDGYYFLISGDGFYSIYYGSARDWRPLVRWNRAAEIHTDGRSNRIRAICAGNYLALYVNDAFMAETTHHVYVDGVAGLAVVSLEEQPVAVEFDDVLIMEARLTTP